MEHIVQFGVNVDIASWNRGRTMNVFDVVQFNENHDWIGCIGVVTEIKGERITVGVPIPMKGIAYIYARVNDLMYIGKSELVFGIESD